MTSTDPIGTFPDRHTIRFELTYPHPRSRVWLAVTEPAHLAEWFMPMTIEPRVGGSVTLKRSSRALGVAEGIITVFDPEAVFEFRFEEGAPGVLQPGVAGYGWPVSTLRFELSAIDPDSCRLVFWQRLHPETTHRSEWAHLQLGGPGTFLPGTCAGWHGFFDPGLARYLDGARPVYSDDDDEIMANRTEQYARIIEGLVASDPAWARNGVAS